MKIQDVMTPCPHRIDARAILPDALKIMKLNGIRHLPVVEDGNVIGILTEREALLSQSICEVSGHCPDAGNLCARDPYTVPHDEDVAHVAQHMAEKRKDCALVADKDGNLIGIFTTTDACKVIYLLREK